jgi:citrate synthase
MDEKAIIRIGDRQFECPTIVGSEHEKAIDVRQLRGETGYITYDDGYGNTGSCQSAITYIDGDEGILRHRGYPIQELAEHSDFVESAYLIIYGELPTEDELRRFRARISGNANLHEGMLRILDHFPDDSHPMAILSVMLNAIGCHYSEMASNNREQDLDHFNWASTLLLAKVRTIAALTYRMKEGKPWMYSKPSFRYCQNFLHMMFSEPYQDFMPREEVIDALDLILLLHADHEQNCSTSTVRMIASSGANLFASVVGGVSALWGPLHGGANMEVVKMLQQIHDDGDDGSRFIAAAKDGKQRLMGFGHRVYKNFDPRSRLLRSRADKLFAKLEAPDPLLDIAKHLEDAALKDDYFIERKLYPNVDFYSGIILRAIGIPLEMFTVIFAIGRMPGWIAHWRELASHPKQKIHRPRQIYTGATERRYVPLEKR